MENFNSIILPTIFTIIAGIVVFLFGKYYEANKVRRVRKIAVKSLKIFNSYARKHKTFYDASASFNNELNSTEKRAVLVCLHKIGIPVLPPLGAAFDIQSIIFERKEIDQEEVKDMIRQVKSGHCDILFYEDVDKYFTENARTTAFRNVAIKFINDVFKESTLRREDDGKSKILYPENWFDRFSYTEKYFLETFKNKTCSVEYFDTLLFRPIKSKLDDLIKEVELGYWDNYFNYDPDYHRSIQLQNDLYTKLNDQAASVQSVKEIEEK